MKHLEDFEFAAILSGEPLEPDAGEHLASCLACRQQLTEVEALISERREEISAEDPDWERQRQEIMARLDDQPAARPTRRWLRPLLAAAALVAMAIGVRELTVPTTPVVPRFDAEIQIEEILAEVDAVLSDDSLPGFESIDPGFDDPESMIENGAS